MNKLYSLLSAAGVNILVGIVTVWQFAISPLFGERCRFYPSCSHYACQALRRHGVFRGSLLSVARIFRCHPFCEGGVDLVP